MVQYSCEITRYQGYDLVSKLIEDNHASIHQRIVSLIDHFEMSVYKKRLIKFCKDL